MDKKAKYLAVSAGVLAAVLTGSYLTGGGGDDAARANTAISDAAPDVALALADQTDSAIASPGMDASRPTDCLIEPSQVVRVNSGVEGVIELISVERGDLVTRGQVVAQLDASVDRAASAAAQARASNPHVVRAAESRAAYLASVSRRSEEISEYLAADQVEQARSDATSAAEERNAAAEDQRVARLEYAQSQRMLAGKTVRSPVTGIVTERVMSPGEYRGPDATHIITVAQINPLYVEVFAPISQLGSIAVGDQLMVMPEEPVGGEFMARVTIIDRVYDAASGTFGMRLELPNPDNSMPAGLRCTINFGERSRRATES